MSQHPFSATIQAVHWDSSLHLEIWNMKTLDATDTMTDLSVCWQVTGSALLCQQKLCIQSIDKGVQTHLTNNKVGDALCNLLDGSRHCVLDFTVVHSQWINRWPGTEWNKNALANKVCDKWNSHIQLYAVLILALAAPVWHDCTWPDGCTIFCISLQERELRWYMSTIDSLCR
jgi:hypothetical protein